MKVFGLTIGEGGSAAPLVLGAPPAVDLLPPEVRAARKSRGVRRGVVAAAVLVVLAVVAGGTVVKLQSITAEVELALAQSETQALLARQAEFGPVLAVQAEIEEREAARRVITSTEIDWQVIIDAITATLPDDASLTSVTIDSGSPMAAYAQPVAPLQGSRVATVTFSARSAVLLSVPGIEDELSSVPGFVDVQVPSATEDPEGGFATTFVVHLDEGAYTGRFPAEEAGAEAEQPAGGDPLADAETESEGQQ